MPQRGDRVAARAARILKAGRPPRWSTSDRMSGVFTKRLPRKYSTTGGVVSSWKYCVSSSFELRQVKYVYDWVKPVLASSCMILGRGNAPGREVAAGGRSRL